MTGTTLTRSLSRRGFLSLAGAAVATAGPPAAFPVTRAVVAPVAADL